MSEWSRQPLRVLTTKIGSGATPRGGKEVYRDEGVAFIRSQNVYNHAFSGSDIARITEAAAAQLSGVTVEEGDVLVNITGESVTRTCIVDPRYLPARVSQHVAIVRANRAKIDPRFLVYALLNPPIKENLNTLSEAGATRRALTKSNLESLEIAVPPLPNQERIAGVLRAFDELIETNLAIVDAMDALGRALVERAPTGALTTLRQACHVIESGRRPKGGVAGYSTGTPSLGAESVKGLKSFDFTKTKYVPKDFAAAMKRGVLENLDVLVYKDGGKPGEFFPNVSAVAGDYPFDHMTINEHVFRVRVNEGLGQGYLYFWLSTDMMMGQMKEAGSRTAAIPGMNSTNFGALPIAIPSQDWVQTHIPALDELLSGALALLSECRDLSRQRDELLPLLMSGRVKVEPEGTPCHERLR